MRIAANWLDEALQSATIFSYSSNIKCLAFVKEQAELLLKPCTLTKLEPINSLIENFLHISTVRKIRKTQSEGDSWKVKHFSRLLKEGGPSIAAVALGKEGLRRWFIHEGLLRSRLQ